MPGCWRESSIPENGRDAQFRYVSGQAREHLAAGDPVVSVDTKKKELVGEYRNGGREWRPAGEAVRVLDTGSYPAGMAVSDAQLAALAITRHDWHGQWNYTLHPQPPRQAAGPAAHRPRPRSRDLSRLCHPAITGMPASAWDDLLARLTVPREAQREAFLHNQRELLTRLRYPLHPAATRLDTLADLATHAAAAGIDLSPEIKATS
jgi:hypothetical protein